MMATDKNKVFLLFLSVSQQTTNLSFGIRNGGEKISFLGTYRVLKKKHTKSKKSKICTHGLGKNLSFCWRKFLVTSPTCLGEADNI